MDIGTSMMAMVALKMLLTMVIVVTASFMVERSGPFLGAMIATLPISAGPSYVFLAMDHGADFIAHSAVATIVTNGINGIFVAVYALMAQRWSLGPSFLAALAAWFAAIGLASQLTWQMPYAIVLNLSCFVLALLVTRHLTSGVVTLKPGRSVWDVAGRAVGVMVLVGVVMLAGFWLGPEAAGYAAPFPIVLSSLIVILHRRIGGQATAMTLVHTLPGLIGFAVAVVVMHETAHDLGAVLSLSLALVICVVWNLLLMLYQNRRGLA